eukprot:SAG31_NODE_2085_length_6489_cov_4.027700_3_plen_173_part_00
MKISARRATVPAAAAPESAQHRQAQRRRPGARAAASPQSGNPAARQPSRNPTATQPQPSPATHPAWYSSVQLCTTWTAATGRRGFASGCQPRCQMWLTPVARPTYQQHHRPTYPSTTTRTTRAPSKTTRTTRTTRALLRTTSAGHVVVEVEVDARHRSTVWLRFAKDLKHGE